MTLRKAAIDQSSHSRTWATKFVETCSLTKDSQLPNSHVIQRLVAIQAMLNAAHQANVGMSSSSKGGERESFLNEFLRKVLPPIYRFGSGDATDKNGNRSGQLDVVIEYPFSPCLPLLGKNQTRLYLAESIAAVVEVKSDVSTQWNQAVSTATQLESVKRHFGITQSFGNYNATAEIPFFVVGYKGWKDTPIIESKLSENPNIAGVLIVDPGIFVTSSKFKEFEATGPESLWGLICCLNEVTVCLRGAHTNPFKYIT
jgi:hypothetical protein